MSLLTIKLRHKKDDILKPRVDVATPHEIERSRQVIAAASEKTKETTKKLEDVLIENGITLKIFVAARGAHK